MDSKSTREDWIKFASFYPASALEAAGGDIEALHDAFDNLRGMFVECSVTDADYTITLAEAAFWNAARPYL